MQCYAEQRQCVAVRGPDRRGVAKAGQGFDASSRGIATPRSAAAKRRQGDAEHSSDGRCNGKAMDGKASQRHGIAPLRVATAWQGPETQGQCFAGRCNGEGMAKRGYGNAARHTGRTTEWYVVEIHSTIKPKHLCRSTIGGQARRLDIRQLLGAQNERLKMATKRNPAAPPAEPEPNAPKAGEETATA